MFVRRSIITLNTTSTIIPTQLRINQQSSRRCLSFWSNTSLSTTTSSPSGPAYPTPPAHIDTNDSLIDAVISPQLTDSLPRFDQSKIQSHIIDASLFDEQQLTLSSTLLTPLKQITLDRIAEIGDFQLIGSSFL